MNKRLMVLTGIVIAAAFARLVPHLPNMTPIAAMALFGGAFLPNRRLAYALPLAAMLLSDLVLGFMFYGKAMLASQPIVYACFLVTVWMGKLIRDRRSVLNVGAVTLASSLMFFTVTNFAVWAAGSLYPRTLPGLIACYTAAIPFFRNTLIGDVTYATALFVGFALLENALVSLREEKHVLTA